MTTSADAVQQVLVLQVGDTPDNRLIANAGVLWDRWADKASVAPRLQELYTKRDLIDLALAYHRTSVDMKVAVRELKNNQLYTNLAQMRADTQAEIVRVEALARARRAATVGALTTTTPTVPPFTVGAPQYPAFPVPDANDPALRGSPYYDQARMPRG